MLETTTRTLKTQREGGAVQAVTPPRTFEADLVPGTVAPTCTAYESMLFIVQFQAGTVLWTSLNTVISDRQTMHVVSRENTLLGLDSYSTRGTF